MVKIYDKDGPFGTHIGTCENGKVYRDGKFRKEEIGSYEDGNVYSGTGWTKKRVGGYDGGTIYKDGFFDESVGEIKNGDVYDGTGLFKNKTGDVSGDYGAAAAAALLFPGCYYREETGASGGGEGAAILLKIVQVVLLAAWNVLKTMPFWGPYASIGLLPFMVSTAHVAPANRLDPFGSPVPVPSDGKDLGPAMVCGLVYVILHTYLLLRRRKQSPKINWPFYLSFVLLVVTFEPMAALPAVAFQIGYIWWTTRKPKKPADEDQK